MSEARPYTYHGDGREPPQDRHPDSPARPVPYVAAPDLVRAVNLAIFLRRPLLLEGEAGCGKTHLAGAVAYELGLPLYPWYVSSTSKAQEGKYQYDAILRLHDVQVARLQQPPSFIRFPRSGSDTKAGRTTRQLRDPSDPRSYRTLGALGKAFELRGMPAVVLIDEIDKADIDFPNDLLAVLDAPWQFDIPETGECISASDEDRPIVIITSNKEKGNLPDPFLRRCIYYFVEFPGLDQLRRIVDVHYALRDLPSPQELVEPAITRFMDTRADRALFKKPGTSEFLDWLEVLRGFEPRSYEPSLLQSQGALPYPGILFKLRADWQRYAQAK
jgi:MoxR-like ATPase